MVINEDHKDFVGQIEEILSKRKNHFEVIITHDTRGQAETGYIGCNAIENNDPVFFFNGDTILRHRNLKRMASDLVQDFSGAIDVFFEDRNHFSFVKLSKKSIVEKIAEKEAISRYATTGLYGFSNKHMYIDHFHGIKTTAEMYISDIYKMMMINNEMIKGYVSPDANDTIILGTPEEFFSNKHKI